MAKDKEREKETEPFDLIGEVLNLFGLKVDLGELLESPEKLTGFTFASGYGERIGYECREYR